MKICRIAIIFIVIVGQNGFLCSADDRTVITEKMVHPILKLSVIDINTDGIVRSFHGKVRILKNGSKKYKDAIRNVQVSHDDILEMARGSSIRIDFADGSHVCLDSPQETKWFTFSKKR
jgi:hypothetical protein